MLHCRKLSREHVRELQYRGAIRPGKYFLGRLAIWQPDKVEMLTRMYGHRIGLRYAEPEYVLGIMCDARTVAMPPFLENLELVLQVPVGQRVLARVDPGFLPHLALGRISGKLVGVKTARHRLPIAWMVGAFEQQDLQVRCVDDDENGNRNFIGALQSQSAIADTNSCCA